MKENILQLFIVICVLISLYLIVNMWSKYKRDRFIKKLVWTGVICIPIIGWVFYGGLYKVPGPSNIKAKGKASGWAPHYPPPFGESELDDVKREIEGKIKN